MQSGWAIGYTFAAVLAVLVLPRFGWRALFVAGIAPALLVPAYGLFAGHGIVIFVLGPLVGFFGHGYFSLFGAALILRLPETRDRRSEGRGAPAGASPPAVTRCAR